MTRIKGNIIIVIVLAIIIATFIFIFSITNRMFNDTLTNNNYNNNNNQNTTTENNEIINDEDSNAIIPGTYTIESENEYSYYSSIVIITNNTDSSIDFKISAVHGKDKENVNIGEVKGTAKKINEYKYLFEENIDGNNNKITFEFSSKGTTKYLTIKEEYPNNINPYGGHGVYFASEYKKEE